MKVRKIKVLENNEPKEIVLKIVNTIPALSGRYVDEVFKETPVGISVIGEHKYVPRDITTSPIKLDVTTHTYIGEIYSVISNTMMSLYYDIELKDILVIPDLHLYTLGNKTRELSAYVIGHNISEENTLLGSYDDKSPGEYSGDTVPVISTSTRLVEMFGTAVNGNTMTLEVIQTNGGNLIKDTIGMLQLFMLKDIHIADQTITTYSINKNLNMVDVFKNTKTPSKNLIFALTF